MNELEQKSVMIQDRNMELAKLTKNLKAEVTKLQHEICRMKRNCKCPSVSEDI
jgi:hypothetical protein